MRHTNTARNPDDMRRDRRAGRGRADALFRLEIAVNDALLVHEADCAEDLRDIVPCRAQVERSVLFGERRGQSACTQDGSGESSGTYLLDPVQELAVLSVFEYVVCAEARGSGEGRRGGLACDTVCPSARHGQPRRAGLTQTPLVLESPPQLDDARVSIERLERVALDEDVLCLALALDVLLVEHLEGVLPVRGVHCRDVRNLCKSGGDGTRQHASAWRKCQTEIHTAGGPERTVL